MKSKRLLESFINYCLKHPEERFWQCLRNWSGYDKIEVDGEDTFYFEKKRSKNEEK